MNLILTALIFLSSYLVSPGYFSENSNLDYRVSIQDSESIVSLTDLFTNQEKYRDKTILVKGKVVKVNPNIMGKNWIHIQDGSKNEDGDLHDLTITSEDSFRVDEEVVIKGKIILDKDLGAGYFYDVIMEQGESYKKKI